VRPCIHGRAWLVWVFLGFMVSWVRWKR